MKSLAICALALTLPMAAQAAVVMQGGTSVGDTAGITGVGGASVAANHPAYDNSATAIASEWVWIGDIETNDNASFEFTFDMTGYDLSTASLTGLWGVDNVGSISLNGNKIAELTRLAAANFNVLNAYETVEVSYFNAGLNTLRFDAQDLGGPGAFRATASVTADAISAVPLPAGGALLLSGLVGFAAVRARKKS